MTTMTHEAVMLPRATINVPIGAGRAPQVGSSYPFLRVTENAPAGYSGVVIMPSDGPGWEIDATSHAALQPYLGLRGWWVRPEAITVDETAVPVTLPTHAADLSTVPEEHRRLIPADARWGTCREGIDGGLTGRYLAVPYPTSPGMGPILIAWQGHPNWSLFGQRPTLPDDLRGWYAHGHFDFDPEPESVVEPRPLAVGDRVRVLRDSDQPLNEGKFAVINTIRSGQDQSYCVDYEEGQGILHTRWWVEEVEHAPAEVTPEPSTLDLQVGHWFTWRDRAYWYRVRAVEGNTIRVDARAVKATGHIYERELSARRVDYLLTNGGEVIDPASPEAPEYLRATVTPPVGEVVPEGEDVAALRRQLAELQERYDSDLRTIAEVMKAEADNREWCTEYEDVARRINSRIHGTFDGEREVEMTVRFSGMVSVPFSGTVIVTVPNGADIDEVGAEMREHLAMNGLRSYASLAEADWSSVSSADVQMDEFDRRR